VQLRELGRGRGQGEAQLLEPARDAHRPALVAEVPLDLADDRRRRVRGELHTAVRVEAVDRLDQPDRGDLGEVVERLAAVAEAACEMLHERQVHADQLIAQLRVLGAAIVQRAQFEEHLARPAAVRGAVRTLCVACARRFVLGVSLVLAHRPARRPSPSPRLLRHSRLRASGGTPLGRRCCDPSARRRAPHGTVLGPLPAAREDGPRGVVLRMRAGLLGDAVDAVRHTPGHGRTARVRGRALGRQLSCAALFVPHRPVLFPHAGPGPAPRCL
jgi:hypothetical protein